MKKITCLLAVLLLVTAFPSCGKKSEKQSCSFFLMDTTVTVTLWGANAETADAAFAASRALLSELDTRLWSRTAEASELSAFNRAGTEAVALDGRTLALMEKALEVSTRTGGAFDVTLAPLSDLWNECGERDALPTDGELSRCMEHTGWEKLTLTGNALAKSDPALQIDLGGIGKGEAIGLLLDCLRGYPVTGGLISFGSNVAVFGKKPDESPFRVGLRDPKDARATVGTLTMEDGMILSVSGDYERFVTIGGERYHHILDPATGYPSASGLSSVAVLCRDGALADALSTALLVMGSEKALAFYESGAFAFEAVMIASTGEILRTPGFPELS